MMELFSYQRSDVNALLRGGGNGFVVAETGAGKTLVASQFAIESGLETKLIIAPKGTHKRVWVKTLQGQDPNARVRIIEGTETGKAAYSDLELGEPGYYLVTPQLFTRWKFQTVRPDLCIIDEAHMLSNHESAGSKLLYRATSGFQAGHRVAMSGTMVRNKFENFWPLLRWIYSDLSESGDIADRSRQNWITEYCETEYDHFAPGNRRVVGELDPGRLAGEIPTYLQHFKRAECCAFHPEGFLDGLEEPITIDHSVELTSGQKKAMKRMETDYVAWLDEHPLVANLPIVARIRLRQMALGLPSFIPAATDEEKDQVFFASDCESPKIDLFLSDIWAPTKEPMIISTTSQKFAEAMTARLNGEGIRSFEWSGQKTQVARDQALMDFEAGKYDVIVGQSAAISTGLDGFQNVTNVLVSMDEDDDNANNIQLEGRLDRRGQARQVIHHRIIAEGSLDAGIISNQLERRLSLARSLRKQVA